MSEYRRRLQHRQTTVIGGTLVALVTAAAVSLAVLSGMIPAPFEPGFSSATPETDPVVHVCPPADAVTVEMSSIPVNVYNGSETTGLAKGVSTALTDSGLTVGTVEDWNQGIYNGNVLLTTSEAGIANAYTLAQAFHGEVSIKLDSTQDPADPTVNVVLGSTYKQNILTSSEIAQIQSGQPIAAPTGCLAPEEFAPTGDTASPTP